MSQFLINPYSLAKDWLLDTYTGAAGAYAVRRLSGSYAGACLRVRRSNDNAEQDIGFDAGGNLDEAQLTAFVGANSGFVTTWYDQSGNGRNATQTTSGNQPRIVNSGTVDKDGGRISLDFNGTSHFLSIGSSLSIYQNVGYGQAFSVINSSTSTAETRFAFYHARGGSPPRVRFTLSKNTTAGGFAIGGRRLDADGVQYVSTSYFSGRRLATSFLNYADRLGELYLNGTLATSNNTFQTAGNTSNTAATANSTIGKAVDPLQAEYWEGKVQEMIFYNTDQTANRSAIETDINGYYSIY
jgi:hypothetical protein